MARYKRHRPYPHRPHPPRNEHPESKIAELIEELIRKYGSLWWIWWLVKKALLVSSVITDIVVIALSVANLVKGQKMLLSGVGIAVGLLLMAWALGSVSRFRVSVLRAVMIPVITAIYAVFFLAFIGLINA